MISSEIFSGSVRNYIFFLETKEESSGFLEEKKLDGSFFVQDTGTSILVPASVCFGNQEQSRIDLEISGSFPNITQVVFHVNLQLWTNKLIARLTEKNIVDLFTSSMVNKVFVCNIYPFADKDPESCTVEMCSYLLLYKELVSKKNLIAK